MYLSYATCWHANEVESAAMWKLYSTEHAGVAIVTTPGDMRAAVDLKPYKHAVLGPVEYLDFKKDDMTLPFGKKARVGFLKRKSFEHEKEVRGLFQIQEDIVGPTLVLNAEYLDGLKRSLPPGINAPVSLKRLIRQIYISPLAPEFFRDLVRTVAKRHGLAKLVRESSLCGEPVF
jgi:hypothetical protein